MKFIIELDGIQHLEQQNYDKQRTDYFESQGYKVIRFWNDEIINSIENVLQRISDALLGPRR